MFLQIILVIIGCIKTYLFTKVFPSNYVLLTIDYFVKL